MSQETIEVVRSVFGAWNAGDMDAVRDLLDSGVILRNPEDFPEPGPFVGRDAVMREWEQLRETWDADSFEFVSDFIDAADRGVVRLMWRAAGQGPEANMEVTTICTVRKGRVFGVEFFWDHVEALETVGLSEQDAHAES